MKRSSFHMRRRRWIKRKGEMQHILFFVGGRGSLSQAINCEGENHKSLKKGKVVGKIKGEMTMNWGSPPAVKTHTQGNKEYAQRGRPCWKRARAHTHTLPTQVPLWMPLTKIHDEGGRRKISTNNSMSVVRGGVEWMAEEKHFSSISRSGRWAAARSSALSAWSFSRW